MKTILIAAALVFAACDDNPTPEHVEIGKAVVEMCGSPPSAPGYAVQSDNGTITMSAADYNSINVWRDQVGAWNDCVVNIP